MAHEPDTTAGTRGSGCFGRGSYIPIQTFRGSCHCASPPQQIQSVTKGPSRAGQAVSSPVPNSSEPHHAGEFHLVAGKQVLEQDFILTQKVSERLRLPISSKSFSSQATEKLLFCASSSACARYISVSILEWCLQNHPKEISHTCTRTHSTCPTHAQTHTHLCTEAHAHTYTYTPTHAHTGTCTHLLVPLGTLPVPSGQSRGSLWEPMAMCGGATVHHNTWDFKRSCHAAVPVLGDA